MKDTDTFTTVTVPRPITVQRIKDLLTSAFEGGSNYWIRHAERHGAPRSMAQFLSDVPFVDKEAHLIIHEDVDDREPTIPHRLDSNVLKKGMETFATMCPKHFQDFLEENDDACTADCFLQCCLFKEVKYG